MLPLMALAAAGSTVALLRRAALLGDPDDTSLEDAATADDLVNGIGALGAALLLATGVVWIIWQFRHATNAALLGRSGLASGWAIVGWFVPLANLVLPQLALASAARAGGRRARAVGALAAWWATSAVAYALFVVGTVLRPGDEDIGDLDTFQLADRLVAAGAAMAVVAALLAVVVVRGLSADQAAAFAGGPGGWLTGAGYGAPAYGPMASVPPAPVYPGMAPTSAFPPAAPPGPSGWGPPTR
jgi:hypothetical protein